MHASHCNLLHLISMNSGLRFLVSLVLLLGSFLTYAQAPATLSGTVRDKNGKPLKEAIVSVSITANKTPNFVITKGDGKYRFLVPSNRAITMKLESPGLRTLIHKVTLKPRESKGLDFKLKEIIGNLDVFEVISEVDRGKPIDKIDHRVVSKIPNPTMNFESLLKAVAIGVAGGNELSSQYSVRGGNFDENLVYVNGVEVYRPFLIRSGQQEGLSFINPDMVSSVIFSAGGWEAQYGDKMSSVLSIEYMEPDSFVGSVSGSLQGGAVHFAGCSDGYRFTHNTGIRFRSNQYILNSLDTDGDYKPIFFDAQTYLTWDMSEKWEIGFLGNIAQNRYQFVPQTRQTDFGTINQALRLTVFFDGQEIDRYQTYFGAFTNTFKIDSSLTMHLNASLYRSLEDETFDIIGAYRIDELERDLGDDDFGDVAFSRGVGQFHDHGRNFLDALVMNVEHKGFKTTPKHRTGWGLKLQREQINDVLSEWGLVDSSGYSLPHPPDSIGYQNPAAQPMQELQLNEVIKANISLATHRIQGFAQREWNWQNKDTSDMGMILGVRANWWDYNNELLISPRANFYYKPYWKRDFLFKLSGGFYYQPPFYRELRDFDGVLNPDIKAQRSIHAVAGMDFNFRAWNRPFKFITETYYKHITNAIPYDIDNVRIRYYARNSASAYATGLDFKLNGELVPGVESWLNMSVMTVRENLSDDNYFEYINTDGDTIIPGFTFNRTVSDSFEVVPGFIPRPTDQRVNFSMVFQDYFPGLEALKMHMTLFFATGLPFGPPKSTKFRNAFRTPPYRRVDLGFSYLLKKPNKEVKPGNPLKHFRSVWLHLECFNLLQINNTISYLWVKDVTNRSYAVPNFLTSRQVNLKLRFEF